MEQIRVEGNKTVCLLLYLLFQFLHPGHQHIPCCTILLQFSAVMLNQQVLAKLLSIKSCEKCLLFTAGPSSVQNLTIENRTVDSLQIGWKPPRGPQNHTYTYCVCLIDCTIINESLFLKEGLKEGTMYTIEVKAIIKSNVYGNTKTINAITGRKDLVLGWGRGPVKRKGEENDCLGSIK